MPKCDRCNEREAAYYQHFTGLKLCGRCLIEDVKSRVKREIDRFSLIKSSDTVLLALSGGKDSFVLLDALSSIVDSSRLIGFSIVEGIPNYNREEYIARLKKYASDRGVDLVVSSLKEMFGYSLHDIVSRARAVSLEISPCTFCGAMRRRGINLAARMLGASKTATAHNLDDEVQTLFMNILRGDPERLIRQHPLAPRLSSLLVQRIKPLRKIYEREATAYAFELGFKFQETECPYITFQPTLRARIRHWLYMLERERPGAMLSILEKFDSLLIRKIAESKYSDLPTCRICGEPTSIGRTICKLCELMQAMGIENGENAVQLKAQLSRTRRSSQVSQQSSFQQQPDLSHV
ncbi:MAG: TIGR00269 family protein [Fervidicoccaceae archaeon]